MELEVSADGPTWLALQRDSFRRAVAARRKDSSREAPLILEGVWVLNTLTGRISGETGAQLLGEVAHGSCSILLHLGMVVDVRSGTSGQWAEEHPGAVRLQCHGLIACPGLCDAHVHCTATTANLWGLLSQPESYVAVKAAHILERMLGRGFTTVRDAGGADFGLAQAVEEGLILGPRLLFTGHALSQTGGHGDFRQAGEMMCACGAALRGIGRVCDGDTEVRRAARDELRKGAHCLKIMASGGIASPTDRLTNLQFSPSELRAIVEEAESAGTYACAHAYTPAAIKRAVEAGVRSIEHGNWLDASTAELMAQKGVYLVPTVITYQALQDAGVESGMPEALVAKVGDAVQQGLNSLQIAREAGVTMCFGSDLLGALHDRQLDEFQLRGRVLPPAQLLQAATVNCAELFCMQSTIGRIAPGFAADILLIAGGNPLYDISLLHDAPRPGAIRTMPDDRQAARGVVMVLKDGLVVRGEARRATSAGSDSMTSSARPGALVNLNELLYDKRKLREELAAQPAPQPEGPSGRQPEVQPAGPAAGEPEGAAGEPQEAPAVSSNVSAAR